MVLKLAVVCLLAEDIPTCTHFYQDVIGLKLVHHHEGKPHFDLGGALLVILQGKPALASERFPSLAFSVDDLDAAISNLEAHHVSLPWGIETDPHSRWVMFRDPAGNLVEMVQFE